MPRGPFHQTLGTLSQVFREKAPVTAEFLKGRVRSLAASLSPRPEEPLLAQEFTVVPGKRKERGDSSKDQLPLGGMVGREGHLKGSWAKPLGDRAQDGGSPGEPWGGGAGEGLAEPEAPVGNAHLLSLTPLVPANCSWAREDKSATQTWHALTQEEP